MLEPVHHLDWLRAATHLPKSAPPIVSTIRHDIYPSISPAHNLANAARCLSVLITGSGRGVGRAEALAFAQAGAKKIVLTSRSRGELEEAKKEIEEKAKGGEEPCEVVVHEADLCDPESVEALFEAAGELDVLINNAGYLEPCVPIRDSDPTQWKRTLDINHYGTYLATRAFLRAAHARGVGEEGQRVDKTVTVINTSSVGSAGTRPGFSCYQPGKSMINRFTEFIHFEEPSVRTFAFHPGGIMTKLARDSMPPDTHDLLNDKPELAAGFAVWLATSTKADFLRGRYVSANWDVDQLVAKQGEIIEKDLLWTRVVGQEQVMPKSTHVHFS
ncbi:hypothetical protein JCM10908_002360 [Rhodotorula pacifica]|uniref:SDR family oxidoreductase n=1 Tax=Rhodotorula pacifica TaxID=1495444 RepID=UPI003178D0F7